MNVNDAISEVNTNIRPNPKKFSLLYYKVAIALADEVERLRAEVQRLDIAGTHSCHDDCPKLPCVQRREIERLRAELAAAKAASVVPGEV